MLAAAEQRPEFSSLDLAEVDPIAYIHGVPPCSRHAPTTESDGRRESFSKNLHAQAGPVSGLYPTLYAAAPQAPGRNRHPGIFPRQPAFGSPDGAGAERAGLITRQPRTPRSIEVLVDSKLWP